MAEVAVSGGGEVICLSCQRPSEDFMCAECLASYRALLARMPVEDREVVERVNMMRIAGHGYGCLSDGVIE